MSSAGKPSLADQVYEHLLTRITDETYELHSRLPNEECLAQEFGVSRPVVRAALARLRTDGIVQSRRGSGSYVVRRPDCKVGSFVSLGSITDIQRCYEFRIDLEGAAAGWAARRRDEDDLRDIEKTLRELETRYQEKELAIEADQRFHLAVARASHNAFFVSTLESLRQQIAFGVSLSRSLTMLDEPQRQEKVLSEHHDILDAIRAKDHGGAERAMRAHITAAKNRMFIGQEK